MLHAVRWFISALLLLAALQFASALAQNPFASQPDFLPAEQAFVLSADVRGEQVDVYWDIEPEYYLYRHQLDFRVLAEQADTAPAVENVSIPDGKAITDEYFGDVEVYYHDLRVSMELAHAADAGVVLEVRYQGCAEAGLCYPPDVRYVELTGADAGQIRRQPPGSGAPAVGAAPQQALAGGEAPVTRESRLAAVLSGDNLWLAFALFFLAGLGLTFTPCVLPMVPILASIIAGQGEISRGRAATLSLTYVLAMALTYALLGVIIGYFGGALNLQGWLQSPPVLIVFAALFVLLALAMFGVFSLQLPEFLRARLESGQQGGRLGSVALMGALSSILVSPCVSAPLAGALIYIGATGDAVLGGAALLALGLGMGVPLLAVGIGGAELLPRAGVWMNGVKAAFGILLLGVAVWLLERIVPGAVALALWSALAIGAGVALGALDFSPRQGWGNVRKGAGAMLFVYGVLLLIGAASGGTDPLRPLAPLADRAGGEGAVVAPEFRDVAGLDALQNAVAAAQAEGRPVMVELYADWCISCKVMERNVFPAPEVRELLGRFALLRVDVTANSAQDRALLSHYGLFGPPSMLFFSPAADGEGELRRYRVQGELGRRAMAEHLQQVLAAVPASAGVAGTGAGG